MHQGFGALLIVDFDESSQFSLQVRHDGEYAMVQGATFQLSEQTFSETQPR
jgi:hypothetical protein